MIRLFPWRFGWGLVWGVSLLVVLAVAIGCATDPVDPDSSPPPEPGARHPGAGANPGAHQPEQPLTGPGGRDYPHAVVSKHSYGAGAQQYWVFEPDQPRPASAPLVVFLHGWGLANPRTSGAWIEHVVRRGNIVVYPRCQLGMMDDPLQYVPNAAASLRDALQILNQPGHVHPEIDKVAFMGYSMGGLVAANLAVRAPAEGLPQPKALLIAQPGRQQLLPLEDLSKLPAPTLLVCVLAESDLIVGEADGRAIYRQATAIPAANKALLMLRDDQHGQPPLLATHPGPLAYDPDYDAAAIPHAPAPGSAPGSATHPAIAPASDEVPSTLRIPGVSGIFGMLESGADGSHHAPTTKPAGAAVNPRHAAPSTRLTFRRPWETPPDAYDYFGYWKLLDGLCDAAFTGRHREYALGDTVQQRFMGLWSDGTPVRPLTVLKGP
jgi:pimeloyl-ACP methyl ester carboxylesterase